MKHAAICALSALLTGSALPARAQAPAVAEKLTLARALELAERQPRIAQARAAVEAAEARVDQARAPMLPQVSLDASYQRSTANFSARPGSLPAGTPSSVSTSFDTYNFFSFGAHVRQLVWDFGQTSGRRDAAEASASAQAYDARTTRAQIALEVRAAFFDARAQRALLGVARETLANQERHLQQIQSFVEVGTRPEIDVVQARTDVANARVQLINAENAYATAKLLLNQAMGVEGSTDYEVADDTIPPIDGEELAGDALLGEALDARPELAALKEAARAQELVLESIHGGFWPTLSVSTGVEEAGPALDALAWNWSAGIALSWPVFEGGRTRAEVREASAQLAGIQAQIDSLRQAVRVELDQARLALRAAKAALVAADEAVTSARTRLELAEGRYETGVGSVIELADAQLALTASQAQRVQADFNVAASRARMLRALGRA